MKRLKRCILLVFLCTALHYAQDSSSNILKENQFALQFQLSGFGIKSYLGSTISGKYQFAKRSAIRAGISFHSHWDLDYDLNGIDTANSQSFSIGFNLQFVRYIKMVDDVALYAGTGPYFSHNNSKSPVYNSYNDSWDIGLTGIIGVEWFFKKSMSLSGEYGLLFYYSIDENNYTRDERLQFSKAVHLTSEYQFKFGISIYL